MYIPTCSRGPIVALISAALSGALAGCSLEDQSAPSFTGPSEFALSVTMSATPDQLPRDGSSQSVVTVTVRNASGEPVAGRRLSVSATIGTVSADDVVTGSDGRATFTFVAPASGVPGNAAVVRVLPVGASADASVARIVTISFTSATNATAPTPSFTMSPAEPVLRQTVVFDASATTDEGAVCRDACTYSWDFGGEATATGRVVTYQFQAVRTYPVKLTVTDAQGSVSTLTQNLAVTQGTAPTSSFTFSPTSPGQLETVNFTAEASRVGVEGRTITSYQWRFGDGATATGVTATHSYSALGTYPVILTVTDSAGIQGTSSTQSVTVVSGVTADFTISPTNPGVSTTVILNAEASKGSSGFGGRNKITKYIWNFGNSTSTTEEDDPITSTSYSSVGTYTIVLTVEDSAGRRNTTSKTLKIE